MLGIREFAPVFAAFALCGCAISYQDAEGGRHVVGLYAMSADDAADASASADVVRRFSFVGLWVDDVFRGTSLAFGEVEFSLADLRNQWLSEAEPAAPDACERGFGFHWCSLGAPPADRAGTAFDIAVSGITIGVGERDRHFGVGYHRQVLLEVTNENALVTWPSALQLGLSNFASRRLGDGEPAYVGLEGLLRGSFNG